MNKPVTVILCSYCPDDVVRGYEARCLKALAENTSPLLYDLIVMGGGDWPYPKKVNAAMSRAYTDYAVILSNDIFVGPNWLHLLLDRFKKIERCGLLSPQDKEGQMNVSYNEHWWACPLISIKAWNEVGPLDEKYLPILMHDQDWNIRAKKLGFEICRTGSVVVEHIGLATRSRIGTEDCPAERNVMVQRYGTDEFEKWVNLHASGVSQ